MVSAAVFRCSERPRQAGYINGKLSAILLSGPCAHVTALHFCQWDDLSALSSRSKYLFRLDFHRCVAGAGWEHFIFATGAVH